MPRKSSRSARIRNVDAATAYALDVVEGKIVAGRFVIAACKRHLDDLVNGPSRGLVWSPAHAEYAFRVMREFKHSKGEFAGQRLELRAWQKFRIGSVFGWLKVADRTRRFTTAFNDVARKNGKSTEAAGVGLVGLTADGEAGAEIYSAATKKDQARLVFDEAKRMARSSPGLRARVKRRQFNMSVAATDSKFEPLSSDVRSLDGLNPHFVLIDELHKHTSRDLLDVMDTAIGSRRQPLIWIITTAGDTNPETVYSQERAYAESVVLGVQKDDSYFAYIACIDDDDDWEDERCWIKGNPNLNVSVKLQDLRRQATKAKGSPSAQREFKRLRLNRRMALAGKEIKFEKWLLCTEGPLDLSSLRGRAAYVGLDLSSKLDLTAAALLFPPVQANERWKLYVRFWCPGENIKDREDRDKASYERWVEEGWIEVTPGDVIDHTALRDQVLEWRREFNILEVLYDPWNATQLSLDLQKEGLVVKEFVQGVRSYTLPTNEFLALVQSEKLEHGGNPVLGWMANNLYIETDKNLNKMPHKKKSSGRIDGMTGGIMALGGALTAEPPTGPSVFELMAAADAELAAEAEAEKAKSAEPPVVTGKTDGPTNVDEDGIDLDILNNPHHPRFFEMRDLWEQIQARKNGED